MRPSIGQNGLDCNPHFISPDCWYYEKTNGLAIYFGNQRVGLISLRKVKTYLAHKEKSKTIKRIK